MPWFLRWEKVQKKTFEGSTVEHSVLSDKTGKINIWLDEIEIIEFDRFDQREEAMVKAREIFALHGSVRRYGGSKDGSTMVIRSRDPRLCWEELIPACKPAFE